MLWRSRDFATVASCKKYLLAPVALVSSGLIRNLILKMEQRPQPAGFFNDGGACSLRYPLVLFYGNKVDSVTEVASCFQLEDMQNYTKRTNKAKTERRPVAESLRPQF